MIDDGAATAPSAALLPVHELFLAQAHRTPHTAAVIAPHGEQLSYDELRIRATRLAAALSDGGVRADVRVGIYLDRSLDLVVAVTAVLMAGGAYVPLDMAYPQRRLHYLAADSGARLVLTKSGHDADFLPPGVRRWNLDEPWQGHAALGRAAALDLAYVIYTSGSTGQPKGVAMPHRPLSNLIAWQNARSTLGTGSRTLQFAPIGFDVSFQEIFATITTGGTLVLVDEATRSDPELLAQYLRDFQIVRLFMPFVALQQLATWVEAHSLELSTLREVVTAGEALRSTPAIVGFFRRHPNCTLDNQYGPTETHVVTAHRLQGSPRGWPARPPIGLALPHVETFVLDEAQRLVDHGEGELYIGGVALAREYLDQPALTAERYDVLPHVSPQRLYRTGDLVSRQPDGTLAFLGRRDEQVKIRGHRIELAEIEAVLGAHPDIAGCAIHVWDCGDLDQRLAASVVASPNRKVSVPALRNFLRARLPEYMVPSAVLIVDRLPLTPSGKVNRAALAPPVSSWSDEPAIAPGDDTERGVLEIWTELLGISGLGVTDNFFDSGGDSLLAIKLLSQIEQRFGKRLPAATLVHAQTIEQLANIVRGDDQLLTIPSIIAVNDTGHGVPFFWVHGLTGSVADCARLGRLLAPEARTFGIETRFEIGVPESAGSITETAATHVAALNAFYPNGPFVLGGWSAGATLSLEMAVQLEAQGRRPLAIVSFDGAPFNSGAEATRWNPLYWLKVIGNLPYWVADDLAQTSAREFAGRISRKLRSFVRRAGAGRDEVAAHTAEIEGFLDIGRASPLQQEFMRRQFHALKAYVPPPYRGRVILYRAATHPLLKLHEYERVWRRLGADLEVVHVRGTHLQIVEPRAIQDIAAHLRAQLATMVPTLLAFMSATNDIGMAILG